MIISELVTCLIMLNKSQGIEFFFSLVNSASIPAGHVILTQCRFHEKECIASFIVGTQDDSVALVNLLANVSPNFLIDVEKKIAHKSFDSAISDLQLDALPKDLGNIYSACYEAYPLLKLQPFKANDLTVQAMYEKIFSHFGDLAGKKVLIFGFGNISAKLTLQLIDSGATVNVASSSNANIDKIIEALNLIKPAQTIAVASNARICNNINSFYDVLIIMNHNSFYSKLLSEVCFSPGSLSLVCTNKQMPDGDIEILYNNSDPERIDIGSSLARILNRSIHFVNDIYPKYSIGEDQTRYVSSGFLAYSSDIIVDNARSPLFLVRGSPRDWPFRSDIRFRAGTYLIA